jgi:RNA polymerase sigma-70 factor, ECF subfamily
MPPGLEPSGAGPSGSDARAALGGRPRTRPPNGARVEAVAVAPALVDGGEQRRRMDAESRQWLRSLLSHGQEREDAIRSLLELLLRGARAEAFRRVGSLPRRVMADIDDLAHQAADDAVTAVLRKLRAYRGDSRFTTWAYKFVIFEVSSALRREAWRGRELPADDERLGRLPDKATVDPVSETEGRELLTAIERAIAAELTPWQRQVFTAVVISSVPIDVLADRHATSRGAVYKVLHDARRKLRAALAAQGWEVESAVRKR